MKQRIVRLIPAKLRPPVRRLYHYLDYHIGKSVGLRDPLLPPEWLHSIGSTDLKDFKEVGEQVVQFLVKIHGLQPYHRVLDVGSGTGRMARPLTKYLTDGGYEGIDVVAPSVEWCQKTYTPRYPNFHFHVSDIYNKFYNPAGKCKASEYRFPVDASSFDFVLLYSVFTHMLPEDVENYLSEVARVLRPGGRCFITYFLLNAQSLELIDAGLSDIRFKYDLPGCLVANADVPESAVAYDESAILSRYQKHDLSLLEPIYFGRWCGRKNDSSFQDLIVATKSH
jgi:SAM-dependent methyltransferase